MRWGNSSGHFAINNDRIQIINRKLSFDDSVAGLLRRSIIRVVFEKYIFSRLNTCKLLKTQILLACWFDWLKVACLECSVSHILEIHLGRCFSKSWFWDASNIRGCRTRAKSSNSETPNCVVFFKYTWQPNGPKKLIDINVLVKVLTACVASSVPFT